MRTAVLSPRARRYLATAVRWIKKDNPIAARGLQHAVRRAAKKIGEHPEIGMHRPELARLPYRFVVLTGFPYVIVYRSDQSPPIINRILHGARDLPQVLRDL